MENLAKLRALDIVVEFLDGDVADVDGVAGEDEVHFGEPGSHKICCFALMLFEELSYEIVDPR